MVLFLAQVERNQLDKMPAIKNAPKLRVLNFKENKINGALTADVMYALTPDMRAVTIHTQTDTATHEGMHVHTHASTHARIHAYMHTRIHAYGHHAAPCCAVTRRTMPRHVTHIAGI